MPSKKLSQPICQSCAVSLKTLDDKGTEADGTLCDDYCSGCYESGEFIEPEITMKEMIEQSVSTTANTLEITIEEARTYLISLFPTLKRWR
ncbi:MAG: zinc ribbon domain-containing protein [Candidatus Heimdallarchaeota archaeon]|nr:MAG: zinc ribbon domain-containing protein [Candidatus Heimdallarchaeota archaeon]